MGKNRQILTVLLVSLGIMIMAVEILRNPQGPLPALSPALTVQAEKHILYGDDRGGGHLHGTGKACKSEFPAEWEQEEVITHVKKVAANGFRMTWFEQGYIHVPRFLRIAGYNYWGAAEVR